MAKRHVSLERHVAQRRAPRSLCRIRRGAWIAAAVYSASFVPASASPASALAITGGGRDTTIIIGESPTSHRRLTAELLQTYWLRGTGNMLPIALKRHEGMAIHVGRTAYVDGLDLRLHTLDEDGFVLKGVDSYNYVIAGPTEHGTEFGVCEFLERYLGVRWLLPGEHGTDVPERSLLVIPPDEVRVEPAFYSRMISGLNSEQQHEWARRLRKRTRLHAGHNLSKLVAPSRYASKRPDFFPILDGRRYLPHNDTDQQWQPNFSADGLIEESIRTIVRHFRKRPSETDYSLGINDSGRFDESRDSQTSKNAKLNYVGLRDFSDTYYSWCNSVVEGVLNEHPDKWFTCLAYMNVAEPPTHLKIHPRLVPFMTYDWMQWADPKRRVFGQALTARWSDASSILGWYDYTFGTPYCLPRVYPHLMQEYMRFGYENGVRAYYSSAHPNWGEGPKMYLHLKLMWDTDLDVDAVLDEWYVRCVGPQAAPDLKEYYDIWERFWTVKIPTTDWFKRGRHYLPFHSPEYLSAVNPEEIRRSRQLLDSCVAKTETDAQRARAIMLQAAFGYYEASAVAYRAGITAQDRPIVTEEDALAVIDADVLALTAVQNRKDYLQRYRKDPVLGLPDWWERYQALRGTDWCAGLLWPVYEWMGRSDAVARHVRALKQHPHADIRRRAETLLALAGEKADEHRLSANPSFESEAIEPWRLWVKANTGSMKRVSGLAMAGGKSVLCDGVKRGGPYQTIPIKPGHYVAFAHALVPREQRSKGTVSVQIGLRGADGKSLREHSTMAIPAPGVWTPICCSVQVPAFAEGVQVTEVLLTAIASGFGPRDRVYLDDIALYRCVDAR